MFCYLQRLVTMWPNPQDSLHLLPFFNISVPDHLVFPNYPLFSRLTNMFLYSWLFVMLRVPMKTIVIRVICLLHNILCFSDSLLFLRWCLWLLRSEWVGVCIKTMIIEQ